MVGGGGVSGFNGFAEVLCHGSAGLTARYAIAGPGTVAVSVACPVNEWHFGHSAQTAASQISVAVDGGAESTVAVGARAANVQTGLIGLDGFAYFDGYVAEAIVYSGALSEGDKTLVNTYLRDKYFSVAPGQVEQMRDAMSRRLWLLRRPQGLLEVTVPLWMLDADILDRIAMEARFGAAPQAAGWGGKKWQRRAFSVQRMVVDPAAMSAKLTLLDRRPLDCLFWDSARTDMRNASARQDGIARMAKGAGYTFARLSTAYVPNPADPTGIVECAQNERAINQDGEQLEEARTNLALRSSFVSSSSGLTSAGTTCLNSSIAIDTLDLFFDNAITAQSMKFTASSSQAVALSLTFPASTSIAGGTTVRFSADHLTNSGEPLYYQLKNTATTAWWNDGSAAFTTTGSVDNSLGTVSPRDPDSRYISKKIPVGVAATTLVPTFLLQAGGTQPRSSNLYHYQIEAGNYPSSRIVTNAAVATRVASLLYTVVTSSGKTYNPMLGALFVEYVPNWSSTDLASTEDMTIYRMGTNSSADYDMLYYDASALAFKFDRKVGATTYSAYSTTTVTRGNTYQLAARWTGADGELNLTNYTISVFVNGVVGTNATTAAPTFGGTELLYFGSNTTTGFNANGCLREWRILPYAPTDEEIARLP